MIKFQKRVWILVSVLSGLLSLNSTAWAQLVTLDELEMINMGGSYRLFIQCSGSTKHRSEYVNDVPQLEIYFRETQLNLQKKNIRNKNTPVRSVTASQWQTSPPVVKVTVTFTRPLQYEIREAMAGFFYVDLSEPKSPAGKDGELVIPIPDNPGNNGADHLTTPKSRARAFMNSTAVQEQQQDPLSALPYDEKITLEAKDAPITDVLRLLSKQSRLNIVAIEDTGKVTVHLKDVSIKRALDLIAKANGFDYVVRGDVILVKPLEKFHLGELMTKVYRLKYIDARNLQATISHILSEDANVEVFYNDFSVAASEGAASEEGGGEASPRGRSSTLVVTDLPINLKQLDAMVAALDVPTPQIMIEAKLIEISPQDEQKLGIDWSKTINAEIFRQVILPGGTQHRYSAEVPLEGGSLNFGTLNFGQYNAALDFLNENTNAKLVSNPRVLAMDNQASLISVGQNIPIPEISRGLGGQGDIVSFEYRNFNVSLEVTPHVAEDDILSLHVNPIVEEIVGEVVVGESRAPITSRREVETVVNLRSQETMVIGGLIKESTIERTSKVWLLGDIPLIGNLFRHKSKTKKQTDLLIFITPRLL